MGAPLSASSLAGGPSDDKPRPKPHPPTISNYQTSALNTQISAFLNKSPPVSFAGSSFNADLVLGMRKRTQSLRELECESRSQRLPPEVKSLLQQTATFLSCINQNNISQHKAQAHSLRAQIDAALSKFGEPPAPAPKSQKSSPERPEHCEAVSEGPCSEKEGAPDEEGAAARVEKASGKRAGDTGEGASVAEEGSLDSSLTYVCKKCGATFEHGQALGGHMSRKHPGESTSYNNKI